MRSQQKKRGGKSSLSTVGRTVLWMCVVLVVMFGVLAFVAWTYDWNSKRKLGNYSMDALVRLSNDLGSTYDLQVDTKGIRSANARLSKDVVDALMRFYDDNVQTVRVIIDNLVATTSSSSMMPTKDVDVRQFEMDVQSFVVMTMQQIKSPILKETHFFDRFFSMLLDMVDPSFKDTVIRVIRSLDWNSILPKNI